MQGEQLLSFMLFSAQLQKEILYAWYVWMVNFCM